MTRGIIIALLIIIAALLVFEFSSSNAGAQSTSGFGQIIQNQKLILEKLNAIDKKLDVIKVRVTKR